MRKLLVILGGCFAAIGASQANAASDDPWGPLDDMVGKRFKVELVDLGTPAAEYEYSWQVPGKIIREQTVGGDSYATYELIPSQGGVRMRFGKSLIVLPDKIKADGIFLESRDGALIGTERSENGIVRISAWRLDGSGQPAKYVRVIREGDAIERPPILSQRYVALDSTPIAAVSNTSNAFANPNEWGPLNEFANRGIFFDSHSLLLRVSDDGNFLEFIRIGKDWSTLFGLLRAEGDGFFRFVQIQGFNGLDHLHEGRLQGSDIVLPSLVEPGYQITIGSEYDSVTRTLHARGTGSENQSWNSKGPLLPFEFTDDQIATALKASAEQRARFEEYFSPSYVARTRQSLAAQLAKWDSDEVEAAEQEAEWAAIDAEMEAARQSRPSLLETFAGAYADATGDNERMRRSLDRAAERGLAEGNAIRQRREAGNAPEMRIQQDAVRQAQPPASQQSAAYAASSGGEAADSRDGAEGSGSSAVVVLVKGFQVPITPGATSNEMCFTRFSIGPITSDTSRRLPEAIEAMASAKSEFLNECSKLGELTSGSGADELLLDSKAESAYGNFQSNKRMHEVTVR